MATWESGEGGHEETLDGSLRPVPADDPAGLAATQDGAVGHKEGRAVVTVRVTRLGRFTLLQPLGQGGMGSVFAAYDQQLDRRVALKLLHQRTAGSTLQRQRTLHEARAVARISHPNVVSVYDVGESEEHIYIAMEYVDGETLAAWQARGGHSWREVLGRYLHAGAGLEAAHAVGVVHRDFKPDNVLCGKDGRLRVVDFGLARIDLAGQPLEPPDMATDLPLGDDSAGLETLPGAISGTPGYMSPEQYRGGKIDGRSDQFSFCAALFEGLYGYLPFAGETLREKADSVNGPPRPPPRDSKVPEEVHRAVLRGLAVDPDQRFPSMTELLSALSLEHGDHAGGRTIARNRLLRAFGGVGAIVFALVQIRQSQRGPSPYDMIIGVGVVLLVVLGLGLYFRKELLGNRFHRSMWLLCVLNMSENGLQRLFGLKLGLPIQSLFPFEMVVLAANITIMGMYFIRWLIWVPLLPLTAAVLSVFGLVPLRILMLTYFFFIPIVAIAWTRAAKSNAGVKNKI